MCNMVTFSLCENNRSQRVLCRITSSEIPRVGEVICVNESCGYSKTQEFIVRQVYYMCDCYRVGVIKVLVDLLSDGSRSRSYENNVNIKELAYGLYKQDWISTHVDDNLLAQSMKDYYSYVVKCNQIGSIPDIYEVWLGKEGYDGYMFVCYEEFCANEYLDEGYVKSLLKDDNGLIALYMEDLTKLNSL